jgi:AbrB family looped-hinge helix DNA binding protein
LQPPHASPVLTAFGKKASALRITTKGQVTIPQEVRERAGLMPGTDVAFEIDAGAVRLVKAAPASARRTCGQKLVESLRGRGDFKMTTDEIVALMRGPAAEDG